MMKPFTRATLKILLIGSLELRLGHGLQSHVINGYLEAGGGWRPYTSI